MISQIRVFLKKRKEANFFKVFAFLILTASLGFAFSQESQKNVPTDNSKMDLSSVKGFKDASPKNIKIKNFSIFIPKIGINAPVIANVKNDKKIYLKALERGVAHFQGTSLPGQGGNIVIFGHSAYYWNRPGNYKEIFRDLEDLKINDIININFNRKKYSYEVIKTLVVNPTEAKYMGTTKKERLTLITCVPPGTTKYRLIVIAEPTKRD
jgi:sortase A